LDVAIIGGGPAGSTVGALLKKYDPSLEVTIFERETFPRDHIGESLLPPISPILYEMGVWDKIDAADFPIKIGATYRWGKRPELWDFDFIPVDQYRDEPRPAPYEGNRRHTAFQVDRSIYDKILLDHAAEMGCDVRQNTKVARVEVSGGQVDELVLESGEAIDARYYVDASGNSGILRRALDVACDYPTTLKNIAVYDYWQNAEWAVNIGVGATRIQIYSLGYGWIWFIPLGPTRTSIGLVVPAEYYKESGLTPEQLYRRALESEERIADLTKNATCENLLQTTRDWSFLAEKHCGPNWFLVGECAGFADPILSAGVSMAHVGAKQLACTILELDRGNHKEKWLKEQFSSRQAQRIRTHIRFGDYWYTANAQLTDLKEFTTKLADDVGLELSAEKAWDWIARGGFIDEDLEIGIGGFGLNSIRYSGDFLTDIAVDSPLETNNVFQLDLKGASWKEIAAYGDGAVVKVKCYTRGGRVLPIRSHAALMVGILEKERRMPVIVQMIMDLVNQNPGHPVYRDLHSTGIEVLEAMVRDGWVKASFDPNLPLGNLYTTTGFQWNKDAVPAS
jgi:flavin-dependent dehydrogenase